MRYERGVRDDAPLGRAPSPSLLGMDGSWIFEFGDLERFVVCARGPRSVLLGWLTVYVV